MSRPEPEEIERAPSGIAFVDHTADVGIEIRAPTLPELFARAALGMTLLIEGSSWSSPQPLGERTLSLSADDLPQLMRVWLRELLYLHETEGGSFRSVSFTSLAETRLDGVVRVAPSTPEPVREIKGVTLHGLAVEPNGDGWRGRVIFDV